MLTFDPSHFTLAVAELLHDDRLAPLGPGQPNEAVRAKLAALTPASLLTPQSVRDQEMAAACLAGLWLYHDYLDESHRISQDLQSPTGGYWHGLMHRREPDFGNAKYWFRQVGAHPIFPELADAARVLATGEAHPSAAFLQRSSTWDPFAFIDLCEASFTGQSPCEPLCRRIQRQEWELLFAWCYRRAGG